MAKRLTKAESETMTCCWRKIRLYIEQEYWAIFRERETITNFCLMMAIELSGFHDRASVIMESLGGDWDFRVPRMLDDPVCDSDTKKVKLPCLPYAIEHALWAVCRRELSHCEYEIHVNQLGTSAAIILRKQKAKR